MPKLLQIDSCLGILSTGKITESIANLAITHGWDCYIMHGARCVGKTIQHHFQVTSKLGEYIHYLESYLFDRHGLGSRFSTKKIIKKIEKINPDIIHLHCIHGYYINYQYLFEYLNTKNIPIVWTFHDCWAFTGHCAHFITVNCKRWNKEDGCYNCPLMGGYPKSLIDNSRNNFRLKKKLFTKNKNIHVVAVSNWLMSFVKKSFFADKDIRVINNGVDIFQFRPCGEKKTDKFTILGVASAWSKTKGLFDFYKLRKLLPQKEYDIILVGLSRKQLKQLPHGITGINRTNSVEELARLYSEANVFVNPTYADSFPTVNMESLACGTPVITYRTGGAPEIIDSESGIIIDQGDLPSLVNAIEHLKANPISSHVCRSRAERLYNKDDCFKDYLELYNLLLKKD